MKKAKMNQIKFHIMKRLLIILSIIVAGSASFAQTHFTPVWTGNGLDHMNIYITSITVNGVSVIPGSEIGVFDGDICVGAAVRPTVINNFIEVRVSKDDPTTGGVDGYTPGNPISFRIYDLGLAQEHLTVKATYSSGTGFFEPGATVMVALSVSVNRKPIAIVSQSQAVNEGVNVTFNGANSSDPDGDALTYKWTVSPQIEGLNLSSSTLIFVAPEVVAHTNYTISLIVNDGKLDSDIAYTSLYVRNVNKPPVITGQNPVETNEDQPFTLNLDMVIFSDPDPNQSHSLIVFPGNNYMLSGLTITPLPNFFGTLSVPIKVTDGVNQSSTFNFQITVNQVNSPPKFTSSPVKNVVQGTVYMYYITATDADDDALVISSEGSPSWLTLETGEANGAATLLGIPQVENVGEHAVTLQLTDNVIETPVSQSFTITVQPASAAPVLETTLLNNAYEGLAYTSPLKFYDSDSDSLIVSLQNAPAWLSVSGAVGGIAKLKFTDQYAEVNLVGNPPISSAGTFSINILFNDKQHNRSKSLPLSVLVTNTPPTANNVLVNTNEDEEALVVLQGNDTETPSGLVYELLSQPLHGTLEQVSSRIFIYTPVENYFGDDEFKYRVKESGVNPLQNDATVYITVDYVNDAPQIAANTRNFNTLEDLPVIVEGISYTDSVDGEFASAMELVANYGPFNGTFDLLSSTYTPNPGFYGTDLVYIAAREVEPDGLESEQLILWFEVAMSNEPAYVSIPDIVLDEDSQITFIPVVSDRESDIENLEYNIIAEPSHGELVINDLAFTYTPEPDWYGTDYVVFQAKDFHGDWTPDLEIVITVTPVNDAPVAVQGVVDAQGLNSVTIDFTPFVSDIDNSLEEISVEFIVTNESGDGMGMQPSTIVQTGNNMTFTYTSQHDANQDYILYRVFDQDSTSLPEVITINNLAGSSKKSRAEIFISKGDYLDVTWGDTVNVTFTMVVGGDNSAPPELVVTNADELNGTLFNIQLFRYNPSSPLVLYRARYAAPSKASDGKPSGNATDVIFDRVGFKGAKGKGTMAAESNADSISIGNLAKKVPVTIQQISNQTIVEGEVASVNIEYTDPDTPDEEITWSIETGLEGTLSNFNLIETGKVELNLTPPENFFGNMVVAVSATDDTTKTSREFMLKVEGLNLAPEIFMVDSMVFLRNSQITAGLLVTDRETPASELEIGYVPEPENAVEQIVFSQGDLIITPAENYSSNFLVNISAYDGVNTTNHQVKFKYKASNIMPSLSPINALATEEDTPIELIITPTDKDASDMLEVWVEVSDQELVNQEGVSVSPSQAVTNTQRSITFTPQANRFGQTDVTVYVTDGLKTVAQQFVLEVLPVNDPPLLIDIEDIEIATNQEFVLSLSATDIDSYIFTYSAESSNSDIDIEVVDNLLTINVLNGYEGETEFTVTVADDSLATSSQVVMLTVGEATALPLVDGISFCIYPNPTKSILYLKGFEKHSSNISLKVYNLQGQLISAKQFFGIDTPALDVSSFTPGIYLLEVAVNGEVEVVKFLKQ